jgi:hypothetical protein
MHCSRTRNGSNVSVPRTHAACCRERRIGAFPSLAPAASSRGARALAHTMLGLVDPTRVVAEVVFDEVGVDIITETKPLIREIRLCRPVLPYQLIISFCFFHVCVSHIHDLFGHCEIRRMSKCLIGAMLRILRRTDMMHVVRFHDFTFPCSNYKAHGVLAICERDKDVHEFFIPNTTIYPKLLFVFVF